MWGVYIFLYTLKGDRGVLSFSLFTLVLTAPRCKKFKVDCGIIFEGVFYLDNWLEQSKIYAFYIFFLIALMAVFIYVYPRYEFDRSNSDVTLGFENSYNAEITNFYAVRDISEFGLSGERVVYYMDFDSLNIGRAQIEKLIQQREGKKITFIGNPPNIPPEEFAKLLDQYNIEIGFLELNQVTNWMREVIQNRAPSMQKELFRVHTIKPAEIEKINLTYPMVLRRWIRAKQERSIDFFWVQPLDSEFIPYEQYGQDIAGILNPADTIKTAIPETNFWFRILLIVGSVAIVYFYSPLFAFISFGIFIFYSITSTFNDATLYLAGLTGAFGITGIYKYLRDLEYTPFLKFLSLILSAFVLGITINALSFSFESVNQIYLAHGVKLTLFYLPFLVFLREFALYGYKDLGSKLHWADLLVLIFVVLFGVYYIIRSGNSGFVLTAERQFRDQLEVLLGIRPRFKEVFGIPALWLYIFGKHKQFGRYSFLIPVLGVVGLCSVVNSFQHVHTPIFTILYREITGVVIGTLIGVLLSFLFGKYKSSSN